MIHLSYLKYYIRHKFFVARAALRLKVPWWLVLLHDTSKLFPDEWFPYARYFYGNYPDLVTPEGQMLLHHPEIYSGPFKQDIKLEFDHAWLRHQKRNKHHYQAWILINDVDGTFPLEMPRQYVREMIADWIGAGEATGEGTALDWYKKHGKSMMLAPFTRDMVEKLLEEYYVVRFPVSEM